VSNLEIEDIIDTSRCNNQCSRYTYYRDKSS